MIDLQLAEYKAGRPFPSTGTSNQELFRQPRIVAYAQSRNGLDLITKQLRDSTWRRHEHHEKQLKHFMDRDRFQRNATWQGEYDRLASQPNPVLHPHFLNARLEELKDLLVR